MKTPTCPECGMEINAGPVAVECACGGIVPGHVPPGRMDRLDRFMREAPPDMPISLDGDCPCGGTSGAHRAGCPFVDLAQAQAQAQIEAAAKLQARVIAVLRVAGWTVERTTIDRLILARALPSARVELPGRWERLPRGLLQLLEDVLALVGKGAP